LPGLRQEVAGVGGGMRGPEWRQLGNKRPTERILEVIKPLCIFTVAEDT
jgi:hypothetical protein